MSVLQRLPDIHYSVGGGQCGGVGLAVRRHVTGICRQVSFVKIYNGIAMTIPAHQSACHSYRVQTACDVFVWCFVAEAAIKLAGMGLTYFKSGFNCFDFVSGKGDFIHYVYLAIVVSGIIHTLSSFLMKLNCSLSPFCPSSTCILAALR
jgi:hypothetical protein